jgi:CDP-diacylglycerol---serine O-phosphatidyltransferase
LEAPFPPFDPHGTPDPRGPRLREIPYRTILPNLVTLLAICAGLTGVRLAFEHRFETAVIMVLVAAFLDGVDGRLARMLKATSRFGAQMDSLADIVNFGVAPAMVLYAYMLDKVGSFGWIAVLIYTIACGLRLARFNVMSENPDMAIWRHAYFTGVPAPAGAGLVLLPVYLGFIGMPHTPLFSVASAVYTGIIALLLVSRLPVYSGKGIGSAIRRDLVMPLFLVAVLYVLLIASFMWQTLTATAVAFLATLPFSAASYFRMEAEEKRAKRDEAAAQ